MAKRFDVTLKTLVHAHTADWLAFAGLPVGSAARVIDADLSTISSAADKVIRVEADEPYIAHLEFQSGQDSDLDRRMLLYNVLLRTKYELPVRSVALLLRPQADSRQITGRVHDADDATTHLDFRYRLIRLWQQPVESLLGGGPGVLPLAPISNVAQDGLPQVISRIEERLAKLPDPAEVNEIWTATLVLLGLRYSRAVGQMLLSGVRNMKESTTYQAILAEGEAEGKIKGEAEGRIKEARALLLRVGTRRFGYPPTDVALAIESIADLARLEALHEQIAEASSWEALLGRAAS
jgi:predicted transposase YdaD